MEEVQIHVPAMYGDHHVVEVRRILLGLPGVLNVNASSCFQTVQVQYDPAQVNKQAVVDALEEAGYLQPLHIPVESGVPSYGTQREDKYFRHTSAFEQTKNVVSFAQEVTDSGRPLWPCPGMGVISRREEE